MCVLLGPVGWDYQLILLDNWSVGITLRIFLASMNDLLLILFGCFGGRKDD